MRGIVHVPDVGDCYQDGPCIYTADGRQVGSVTYAKVEPHSDLGNDEAAALRSAFATEADELARPDEYGPSTDREIDIAEKLDVLAFDAEHGDDEERLFDSLGDLLAIAGHHAAGRAVRFVYNSIRWAARDEAMGEMSTEYDVKIEKLETELGDQEQSHDDEVGKLEDQIAELESELEGERADKPQ